MRGAAAGVLSGLFGVGGGLVIVPLRAVATLATCGLPIVLSGPASFIWIGPCRRITAMERGLCLSTCPIRLGITSMLFVRFGARLSHQLSPLLLNRLFALLRLLVGINFLR
ncbi:MULTISPECIES: TSUP family transporter [unclassified Halomonas]|uniref:TSUP family transporter n=1 Tax=unclassified Halomonas TaxID=2609666 RepID=UPI001CF645F5|nr:MULTISPECIES: TSUP family transporter [unclassified Halomonas]